MKGAWCSRWLGWLGAGWVLGAGCAGCAGLTGWVDWTGWTRVDQDCALVDGHV